MRRWLPVVVTALVALSVGQLSSLPAHALAQGTPCPDPSTGANPPDGTTIAGPVVVNDKGSGCFLSGGTVNGDVVVSAGAFVNIEFSRVNGSVSVRGPGSAAVIGKSTVTGAVSAQGNDFVDLFGARVGGEVNESGAKFGTSFVCDSTIGSTLRDLQSTDTTFPATIGDPGTGFECGPNTVAGDLVVLAGREGATIRRNTVHGSIIVNANHTSSPIVVAANTVDKQILCLGNTPAPTGGGNTAAAKVGQCTRL